MQNQGQQTPQNITAQNAMTANAKYQQEFANSELSQAPGQISKMLLAGAQAGFEFGNMGANLANKANLNQNATYEFGNLNNNPNYAVANANMANANQANNANFEFGMMNNNAAMANANMNKNSELNQSAGQMSQVLRNQSQ